MLKWKMEFAGCYSTECGRFIIDANGGEGLSGKRIWRLLEVRNSADCERWSVQHQGCYNTLREAKWQASICGAIASMKKIVNSK